jgi:very-short-patch-repair endonuclease
MPQYINNRPEIKKRRQLLRNDATKAEHDLWQLLKGSQLDGRKFRRQHSIGCYILDFYCPSERLAVELDGEPHFTEDGRLRDANRTKFLEENFIKVLRFENGLVMHAPDEILNTIRSHFEQ